MGFFGNDTLQGGMGHATLNGGGGRDTALYRDADVGVHVDLGTGMARGEGDDRLVDIENVTGTRFADTLVGKWYIGDLLDGDAGNDWLEGSGGADLTGFPVRGTGNDLTSFGVQVQAETNQAMLLIDTDGVAGADLQLLLDGGHEATDFWIRNEDAGASTLGLAAQLHGMAYHWRSHALLPGVATHTSSPETGDLWTVSGQDGTFTQSAPPGRYSLSATRSADDAVRAITSADALAALRLSAGVNPNPDPDGSASGLARMVSPYQYMTADVDDDGKVTSADALAILQMSVKSPGAQQPLWMFVDETADLWNEETQSSALQAEHAGWDRTVAVGLEEHAPRNLVAVLRGDVNGNWNAPQGTVDLDSMDVQYFQQLAAQLGVPTGVWGL